MSEANWMADLKAQLAEEGASLDPNAKIAFRPKPTGPGPVVVLERVRAGYTPDYCLHGYASCISCNGLCYLGSETGRMVQAGEAYAVCLQCAEKHIPPALRNGAEFMRNADDHKREDGPH